MVLPLQLPPPLRLHLAIVRDFATNNAVLQSLFRGCCKPVRGEFMNAGFLSLYIKMPLLPADYCQLERPFDLQRTRTELVWKCDMSFGDKALVLRATVADVIHYGQLGKMAVKCINLNEILIETKGRELFEAAWRLGPCLEGIVAKPKGSPYRTEDPRS